MGVKANSSSLNTEHFAVITNDMKTYLHFKFRAYFFVQYHVSSNETTVLNTLVSKSFSHSLVCFCLNKNQQQSFGKELFVKNVRSAL